MADAASKAALISKIVAATAAAAPTAPARVVTTAANAAANAATKAVAKGKGGSNVVAWIILAAAILGLLGLGTWWFLTKDDAKTAKAAAAKAAKAAQAAATAAQAQSVTSQQSADTTAAQQQQFDAAQRQLDARAASIDQQAADSRAALQRLQEEGTANVAAAQAAAQAQVTEDARARQEELTAREQQQAAQQAADVAGYRRESPYVINTVPASTPSSGFSTAAPVDQTGMTPTTTPTTYPGTTAPYVDPNAGSGTTPYVDPNAAAPYVDPNAAAPYVDPNAAAPYVDPNAGTTPYVDPNAAAPYVDPNAGSGPVASQKYKCRSRTTNADVGNFFWSGMTDPKALDAVCEKTARCKAGECTAYYFDGPKKNLFVSGKNYKCQFPGGNIAGGTKNVNGKQVPNKTFWSGIVDGGKLDALCVSQGVCTAAQACRAYDTSVNVSPSALSLKTMCALKPSGGTWEWEIPGEGKSTKLWIGGLRRTDNTYYALPGNGPALLAGKGAKTDFSKTPGFWYSCTPFSAAALKAAAVPGGQYAAGFDAKDAKTRKLFAVSDTTCTFEPTSTNWYQISAVNGKSQLCCEKFNKDGLKCKTSGGKQASLTDTMKDYAAGTATAAAVVSTSTISTTKGSLVITSGGMWEWVTVNKHIWLENWTPGKTTDLMRMYYWKGPMKFIDSDVPQLAKDKKTIPALKQGGNAENAGKLGYQFSVNKLDGFTAPTPTVTAPKDAAATATAATKFAAAAKTAIFANQSTQCTWKTDPNWYQIGFDKTLCCEISNDTSTGRKCLIKGHRDGFVGTPIATTIANFGKPAAPTAAAAGAAAEYKCWMWKDGKKTYITKPSKGTKSTFTSNSKNQTDLNKLCHSNTICLPTAEDCTAETTKPAAPAPAPTGVGGTKDAVPPTDTNTNTTSVICKNNPSALRYYVNKLMILNPKPTRWEWEIPGDPTSTKFWVSTKETVHPTLKAYMTNTAKYLYHAWGNGPRSNGTSIDYSKEWGNWYSCNTFKVNAGTGQYNNGSYPGVTGGVKPTPTPPGITAVVGNGACSATAACANGKGCTILSGKTTGTCGVWNNNSVVPGYTSANRVYINGVTGTANKGIMDQPANPQIKWDLFCANTAEKDPKCDDTNCTFRARETGTTKVYKKSEVQAKYKNDFKNASNKVMTCPASTKPAAVVTSCSDGKLLYKRDGASMCSKLKPGVEYLPDLPGRQLAGYAKNSDCYDKNGGKRLGTLGNGSYPLLITGKNGTVLTLSRYGALYGDTGEQQLLMCHMSMDIGNKCPSDKPYWSRATGTGLCVANAPAAPTKTAPPLKAGMQNCFYKSSEDWAGTVKTGQDCNAFNTACKASAKIPNGGCTSSMNTTAAPKAVVVSAATCDELTRAVEYLKGKSISVYKKDSQYLYFSWPSSFGNGPDKASNIMRVGAELENKFTNLRFSSTTDNLTIQDRRSTTLSQCPTHQTAVVAAAVKKTYTCASTNNREIGTVTTDKTKPDDISTECAKSCYPTETCYYSDPSNFSKNLGKKTSGTSKDTNIKNLAKAANDRKIKNDAAVADVVKSLNKKGTAMDAAAAKAAPTPLNTCVVM